MTTGGGRDERTHRDAFVALAQLLRALHRPEGSRPRGLLGPIWLAVAIMSCGFTLAVAVAELVGHLVA